jgi:acyl dehydratase
MSKIVINSYKDYEQYTGKELGVSKYFKITQEHISKFAEATLDFQWVHLDVERAKAESPYKTTLAHGYLVLSLIPYLFGQIVEVNNIKIAVNYGIENLRFNHPVLVNSELRIRAKLNSLIDLRGVAKAKIYVTIEILDRKKTALDGTIVVLYHFS